MRRLPAAVAGAVAATLAVAAPARAQHTIGDPLVARDFIDSFHNFIVVSDYLFPVAAYGQSVATVSVFGGATPAFGSNVGRTFVPLLVTDPSGGSITVTGVGSQIVVGSGIQDYAFGLTQGSAIVGATTRVAWLSVGAGGIHFDADGDGRLAHYTNNASVSAANAGDTFAVAGALDRAYSIQFTAGVAPSAVPEPSTYALLATGLAGLGVVARRRRGRLPG